MHVNNDLSIIIQVHIGHNMTCWEIMVLVVLEVNYELVGLFLMFRFCPDNC